MTSRSVQLSAMTVRESATIRDAMTAISANAREVVLLVDDHDRVLGLITDGDIRRGLLSGLTLDSPAITVMTAEFFAVGAGADRAYVLDVMKARSFQHVPVLDRDRRLIAVHFLSDLIGGRPKPNVAVVMAGGRGTRLRPLTEHIPKPMVQVAGRPILERIVLHLVSHGIHTVFLSVNYKAEMIESYFSDGSAFGCRIHYLRETRPLGTGGPLALLSPRPSDPILVLNGDLVTNFDFTAMLDAHSLSGHAATIGVGPHIIQLPFGNVIEKEGILVTIEEKPKINFLVNRGIYVIEPEALDLIPPADEYPITSLFSRLIEKNRTVGVFHISEFWLDVGSADDLRRAQGLT